MKKSFPIPFCLLMCVSLAHAAEANPEIVLENFIALSKSLLVDIGVFAAASGVKVFIFSILGGVFGFFAGIAVFVILLKKKMLDAPFPWYRYIKWMWAFIFIISFTVTGSSVGLGVASKSAIKRAVYQEQFFRKTAGKMLCAFSLDMLGHRIDPEKNEDLLTLFESSEKLKGADLPKMSDRAKIVLSENWDEKKGNPFGIKMILSLLVDRQARDEVWDSIRKLDGRVVLSLVYLSSSDEEKYQAYLKDHPEHMAVAGVISKFFDEMDKDIFSSFKSFIQTNLYLSLFFGLAFPAILVGLFQLALRHAVPRAPTV